MTRSIIFLVVAIVCFVIALILTAGWFDLSGGNPSAWLFGGLAAFAAAHLP